MKILPVKDYCELMPQDTSIKKSNKKNHMAKLNAHTLQQLRLHEMHN